MSMKFLVIYEQDNEGCDYSIGCGVRVDVVEAPSLADAPAVIVKTIFGEDGMDDGHEHIIGKARFIDLSLVQSVDVDAARRQFNKQHWAQKRAEQDAIERAQYERLRGKFGV